LLLFGFLLLAFLAAPFVVREFSVTEAPFELEEAVHVRVPLDTNQMGNFDMYSMSFTGCYPYIALWTYYVHESNVVSRYVLFDARDGTIIAAGDGDLLCYGHDPVSDAYIFNGFVVVDGNVLEYRFPDCNELVSPHPSLECVVVPIAYREGYVYMAYEVAMSDQEGAFESSDPADYNLYTGLVRVSVSDGSLEQLVGASWGSQYVCPSGYDIYTCLGSPQVFFDGNLARVFYSYYSGDSNYVDIWEFNYMLPPAGLSSMGSRRFLMVTGFPRGDVPKQARISKFVDSGLFVKVYVYPDGDYVYLPGGVVGYQDAFDVVDDANGERDFVYIPGSVVQNAVVWLNDSVPGDRVVRLGYYTSDAVAHIFFSSRRDELGVGYIVSQDILEYDDNRAIFGFGGLYLGPGWHMPPELNDPENIDGYLDAYIFSHDMPVVLPENLADYVSFPVAAGSLEIVKGKTSGQEQPPSEHVSVPSVVHPVGQEGNVEVSAEAGVQPVQSASPLFTSYVQYFAVVILVALLLVLFLVGSKR